MSRRRFMGERKLNLYTKRFYPAGTYSWKAPECCTSVDVFCVGGGGGGSDGTGGGGGYTKTYKKISVTPGETITIVVGAGSYYPSRGGSSYFKTSSYIAYGGYSGSPNGAGGNGGSGGGAAWGNGGYNGGNGGDNPDLPSSRPGGRGQGTTTRDFGESTGGVNAGGGAGESSSGSVSPGSSSYTEGKGEDFESYGIRGGGGYGGGGAAARGGSTRGGKGGDGTVLIRYYAYEQ